VAPSSFLLQFPTAARTALPPQLLPSLPPSAIIGAAILRLSRLPPPQQSFCCFHSKTRLLPPQHSFGCFCCTLTILQPTLLPLQRHSCPTADSTAASSRLQHQQPSYRSRRILAISYHCFLSAPTTASSRLLLGCVTNSLPSATVAPWRFSGQLTLSVHHGS
jgi:hypothetical protein